MKIAIWVIAICEVVRTLQNMVQLLAIRNEKGMRENAYREFVKRMLE